MRLIEVLIISTWVVALISMLILYLYKKVLPTYKLISDVPFEELILTLNLIINTELDLWKKDIFINNSGIANNSQYENYYHEITGKIIQSIAPSYYRNVEKYITKEAVVSIIGRKVKTFLNEYVQEPFPDPSIKMMFDERM